MLVSRSGPTRSNVRLAVVAISLVLAGAACGPKMAEAPPSYDPTAPESPLVRHLAGEVSEARAWEHLQALQRIADEHGGNRAAGTPGYDASVDYVVGVLRGAGFEVSTPTYEPSGEDGTDPGGPQRNVIAQTGTGDPGQVVMIGAHLDSVPDGPGMVDNGTGVASLLEIATRLGAQPSLQNAVRFAFFGNEETGAEGSSSYLQDLSTDDRKKIKLYLNVDMVASPNGGYFVQGGEGDDPETAGPPGSATIGQVLAAQLVRTGVTPEIIEFVGDDESPFIEAGIPVGGAENGDAETKTAEQARAWGGRTGEAYDRCYHTACDRIDNVNREMLDRYLRALAGTVAYFATSPDELR